MYNWILEQLTSNSIFLVPPTQENHSKILGFLRILQVHKNTIKYVKREDSGFIAGVHQLQSTNRSVFENTHFQFYLLSIATNAKCSVFQQERRLQLCMFARGVYISYNPIILPFDIYE